MLTNFRIFYPVYIAVFCAIFLTNNGDAIEHIATIGQPTPIQHAFLNNDTIARVVPTHIQIVDTDTGAVIDDFANLNEYDDVVFSSKSTHFAIQKSFDNPRRYAIEIWDVNAREKISQWNIEDDFRIAAFSPTEPLFVALIDNEINLWNWKTGELIDTMVGTRRPANSCYTYTYTYPRGKGTSRTCISPPRDKKMVFTPDGKYLFVASQRPDIEVWEIETRKLVEHIEGHTGGWVDGLAISSDGTYLASFERIAGIIYIWDVATRQLLWTTKNGIGPITSITFSPNSQQLYVTTTTTNFWRSGLNPWEGWDDKLRVWNVKSGEQIDTIETKFRGLSGMKISPDGRKALIKYSDGVVLWDIEKKQLLHEVTDFVGRWIWERPELSPDGKTFLSLSPHFLKTWDVATQKMGLLISADDYKFAGVAISPDSKKVAVGKDPWIEIIDIQTGSVDTQILPKSVWFVEEIAFSQTGRWLAVSDGLNGLAILDINNPEKSQNLKHDDVPADTKGYREFAFSENDTYFVASGRTRENNNYQYWIQLWKRINNTFVFQYAWQAPEGTRNFSSTPVFTTNADGTTLLATPYHKEIHIWNLLPDRAQLLSKLDAYGYSPVQFTQDRRYLLTKDGIMDWRKNRPIKNRSFPSGYADLSKDGTIILSYNDTGQYDILDITDTLSFLPYSVEPNGKQFVTLGQVKHNQLLQNFPNPFNPETWIPFHLADENTVTISIYSATGKLVRSLLQGKMSAGDYTTRSKAAFWDGRNKNGEKVSSGVYLYTIKAGEFSATRKMLIQK